MYRAFFVLWPNVVLLSGLSYINIAVPGGATGVYLKWKSPSVATHANSFWVLPTRGCDVDTQVNMGRDAVVDLRHGLYVWIIFFCQSTVSSWGWVLKIGVLLTNELFYLRTCFVVHAMQCWLEASLLAQFVQLLVGPQQFGWVPWFDCCSFNVVWIVNI